MCVSVFFPLPADDGGSGKSLFQCGSLTRHIWALWSPISVPVSTVVAIFFFNVPKKKNNIKNKKNTEIEKKKKKKVKETENKPIHLHLDIFQFL